MMAHGLEKECCIVPCPVIGAEDAEVVKPCCAYIQLKEEMLSLTDPTAPMAFCIHHHAGLVALHGAWAVKLL